MAKKNDTRFFENKLLDFVAAKDPLLEMLQWMMDKFMEIEVARKTGAPPARGRLPPVQPVHTFSGAPSQAPPVRLPAGWCSGKEAAGLPPPRSRLWW